MALFLNICNSADFDHFYLCSMFYYLMSSYNKKNNPYIFKNRYHSAFILFFWEEGKAGNFPCVLNKTITISAPLLSFSFAYQVFSQQGSGMCVQERKHKPIVVESPEETRTFFG